MMKVFFQLVIVSIVAICFTGCTQINSSDGGSMGSLPVTVGPTDNYRPSYTVADTTVKASSSVNTLFWIFTWGEDNSFADRSTIYENHFLARFFPFLNTRSLAAQAAVYKACEKADCDAIIAASYKVTFDNYFFFKKTNVEVKGFPAKLTGVEKISTMPYYINGNGDVVKLESVSKPLFLFDARNNTPASEKSILQTIVDKVL